MPKDISCTRSPLGKFFAKMRVDCELTMSEFADILGVDKSYISLIERDKRKIPKDLFDLILEKFVLTDREKEELQNLFDSVGVTGRVALMLRKGYKC